MNTVSSSLLWCVLQVTILAMLTALICSRPWRIGGAWTPFLGLCSVVVVTLFSFVPVPQWWFIQQISESPWTSVSASSQEFVGEQGALTTQPLDSTETPSIKRINHSSNGFSASSFAKFFMDELKKQNDQGEAKKDRSYLSAVVLTIFAIGLSIGIARLIAGLVGVRQLLSSSHRIEDRSLDEHLSVLVAELSLQTKVQLYESNHLTTAATLGWRQPAILLPRHWRTWSVEELRSVLAHELAHISHRDFMTQLLSQVGVVLHFYNPFIHWLSSRLRLEQEIAADLAAAQINGGNRQYVRLLAKLALDHDNQNVGWPARAFLPTRKTFLRRLEMLRNTQAGPSNKAWFGKLVALTLVGSASVALIGIKPQIGQAVAQIPGAVTTSSASEGYDLQYISEEGGVLVALKPRAILSEPKLAEIAKIVQDLPPLKALKAKLDLEPSDVEQVIIDFEKPKSGEDVAFTVRLNKPIDAKKIEAEVGSRKVQLGKATVYEISSETGIWMPDDKTLVVNKKNMLQRMIESRSIERRLTTSKLWDSFKNRPAVLLIDSRITKSILSDIKRQPNMELASLVSPILEESQLMAISVDVNEDLQLNGVVQCGGEKESKTVHETLGALTVLAKNGLRGIQQQVLASNNADEKSLISNLLTIGSKALEGVKVETNANQASVSLRLPVEAIPVQTVVNAMQAARTSAARMQGMNNLKQIALAFHNHEAAYRRFPSSSNLSAAEGEPPKKFPYSWRVAILPFIEQEALYRQYRFDEPWDSDNNKKLLAQMPIIYRHANAAPGSTETCYALFVGKDTIFQPGKAANIAEIRDGTSNTIMLVETKTSIPWTKPEDIEYSSDKPLPTLGGFSPKGFNAAFADGSVRFLSSSIAEKQLRALITANGGELAEAILEVPGGPGAPSQPAPLPTTTPLR